MLQVEEIAMAWDGDSLFSELSMSIRRGDRIGIVGPNGSGKTTLVRCLLGEIDPAAGRVSMKSPVGRALMNRSVGDEVLLRTPAATERLEVLAIRYDPLP